jgi:hypothetical protein
LIHQVEKAVELCGVSRPEHLQMRDVERSAALPRDLHHLADGLEELCALAAYVRHEEAVEARSLLRDRDQLVVSAYAAGR